MTTAAVAVDAVIGSGSVVVGVLAWTVAQRIRSQHQHGPWEVVGTVYTPPDRTVEIHARGYQVGEFDNLLYGYTTLTERCTDCRLIRTRRVSGRVTVGAGGTPVARR